MVVRDGAAIRKERINILIDLVKKHQNDPEVTEKRIIAFFMLQTGLKTRRIKEYIEELIDAGIFFRKGVKLLFPRND